MIFVYTTCQGLEEAKKMARMILEKKLASCVDFWPIYSMYLLEGAIKEDQEVAILAKTMESRLQEIEDLISRNHSYAVPFIAASDMRRLNREYKEWMQEQMQ